MEVWQDVIVLIMFASFFMFVFIMKIAPIIILSYMGFRVVQRTYVNNICDIEFNIKTVGTRKWEGKDAKKFHRTESTPYKALETFYERHDINKGDRVVDFGAGRGRVAFFLHNYYDVDVVGIELNEITFEETEENLKNYNEKFGDYSNKIKFQCINAENYTFDKRDNTYFFFNPFNHTVFKNVIDNIIKDADRNQKDVKVILYYPTRKYRKVMKETDFEIIDKFRAKGRITPTERFIIYEREY